MAEAMALYRPYHVALPLDREMPEAALQGFKTELESSH